MGQGGQLPPQFSQKYKLVRQFYLRFGQSSCSCFVSLIFLIFSFHLSLAPCIKTHTKTQEMALKRLYFSKFSWGAWPRTPLEVLCLQHESGKFVSAPPKISKPVCLCLKAVFQFNSFPVQFSRERRVFDCLVSIQAELIIWTQ